MELCLMQEVLVEYSEKVDLAEHLYNYYITAGGLALTHI